MLLLVVGVVVVVNLRSGHSGRSSGVEEREQCLCEKGGLKGLQTSGLCGCEEGPAGGEDPDDPGDQPEMGSVEGEEEDYWEVEFRGGRVHLEPRREAFVPHPRHLPPGVMIEQIEDDRITEVNYVREARGRERVVDNWRVSRSLDARGALDG